MRLKDAVAALESIAPSRMAASWDNVGLLVGDLDAEISRAVVCVDLTREVLDEARAAAAELVVAYHPPIFEGLKRFVAGNIAFDAARTGIAIYSPHTALDAADGGTNDVLADAVEMHDRAPLTVNDTKYAEYKLVFFVPAKDSHRVCRAVFDAGAGVIGAYSSCSFRLPGTGTFFGGEGANPAVGQAGKLEEVDELRVETVLPMARVAEVVSALKRAHPYEEPAFDLVRLAKPPTGAGMGRIGRIEEAKRGAVIERVKAALALDRVLVAGPQDGEATRVAVCAGSAGDLLRVAERLGAQIIVTGEVRHHDALRLAARGITLIATLHSNSERAALAPYARRIAERCPGVSVSQSARDRDPFRFV